MRSTALHTLSDRVQPVKIQARATEILAAIQKPNSMAEYRLLGMTRDANAKKRLPPLSTIDPRNKIDLQTAIAMLGDAEMEDKLVKEFLEKVKDTEEHYCSDLELQEKKHKLAMSMAYIGSPKTIAALVHELRSPTVFGDNSGWVERYPLRYFVIEALSWKYPEEKSLWEPSKTPETDKFYDAIEDWAKKTFDAKWDRPRPPFHYRVIAIHFSPP